MQNAPLLARLVPLALVAAIACTPRAVEPRGAPKAPEGGARVRTLEAVDRGPVSETRIEVVPGAASRLIVALGDRITALDLTPDAADERVAAALLTFAPLEAQRPAVVTVRSRPYSGAEVIASYVRTLGGDAAVTGLTAASPEFNKARLIEVEVEIETTARGAPRIVSATKRMVITAGEQPSGSSRYDPSGVLAFGAPARVHDWVMAAADGFVPQVHQEGAQLFTLAQDGAKAPLESLPAAAWTLWMQLEPEEKP